jgi:hypothetical protein
MRRVVRVVEGFPIRVGVVIRKHLGECLAACSEILNEVTALEHAEVLAMRRAVSFASDEGSTRYWWPFCDPTNQFYGD